MPTESIKVVDVKRIIVLAIIHDHSMFRENIVEARQESVYAERMLIVVNRKASEYELIIILKSLLK